MAHCCKGMCWICKSEGLMNILLGGERDFFLTIIKKQTNEKITLCNNCFLILLKKQFSNRNSKLELANQSATISNISSSSSIVSIQSLNEKNDSRNSSLNTRNLGAPTSPAAILVNTTHENTTPKEPTPNSTNTSSYVNRNVGRPGPLSMKQNYIKKKVVQPDPTKNDSRNTTLNTIYENTPESSESMAANEPTSNSNNTSSYVNPNVGRPGPLSMKQKYIGKKVVQPYPTKNDSRNSRLNTSNLGASTSFAAILVNTIHENTPISSRSIEPTKNDSRNSRLLFEIDEPTPNFNNTSSYVNHNVAGSGPLSIKQKYIGKKVVQKASTKNDSRNSRLNTSNLGASTSSAATLVNTTPENTTISSRSIAPNEPTPNSYNTSSYVNPNVGRPGPLSMKQKYIEKKVVQKASTKNDSRNSRLNTNNLSASTSSAATLVNTSISSRSIAPNEPTPNSNNTSSYVNRNIGGPSPSSMNIQVVNEISSDEETFDPNTTPENTTIASRSVAPNEPTPNSNNTSSYVNRNIGGPSPSSMIIDIQVVNEISSDEETFDPDVRCPTIQPLIKKRRTPYEPRYFDDYDAPIFDTSNITGG